PLAKKLARVGVQDTVAKFNPHGNSPENPRKPPAISQDSLGAESDPSDSATDGMSPHFDAKVERSRAWLSGTERIGASDGRGRWPRSPFSRRARHWRPETTAAALQSDG